MHMLLPILFVFIGCSSNSTLDQPHPAPTWYIEVPEDETTTAPIVVTPPTKEEADDADVDAASEKTPSGTSTKKTDTSDKSAASKSKDKGDAP